jgi:hypothetical protein
MPTNGNAEVMHNAPKVVEVTVDRVLVHAMIAVSDITPV